MKRKTSRKFIRHFLVALIFSFRELPIPLLLSKFSEIHRIALELQLSHRSETMMFQFENSAVAGLCVQRLSDSHSDFVLTLATGEVSDSHSDFVLTLATGEVSDSHSDFVYTLATGEVSDSHSDFVLTLATGEVSDSHSDFVYTLATGEAQVAILIFEAS